MNLPAPVIGRYELKGRIGGGGMGTLYLARDTNRTTDRLVALKLLKADLDSGDLRSRFDREARFLADLNHPNIVVIYDSGEFDGSPYIVMEFVRGETLAELIRRRAPLTLARKVRLLTELCSGLSHAHDAGIIHRDIKPANLIVDQHGQLKILDFGIARVTDRGLTRSDQLTRVNIQIGTPGYMSPEQIEGAEIDARSDLFSVGAVAYELFAYREAFTGSNTRQIEHRVAHEEPLPLTQVEGLDPGLSPIVARALAKNVHSRYQSAAQLGHDLDRVLVRLGGDQRDRPRDTPTTRDTPVGPHESRRQRAAEAAFRRATASMAEGSADFARRSTIEAIAENPEHEGARRLLVELGIESSVDVATFHRSSTSGTKIVQAAETVLQAKPEAKPFERYLPYVVGVLATLLVIVGGAFLYRVMGPDDTSAPTVTGQSAPPPSTPPGDTPPPPPARETTLAVRFEDPSGKLLDDVQVRLNPGSHVGVREPDGRYSIKGLDVGTYELTANRSSYRPGTATVKLQGGVENPLTLTLTPTAAASATPTPGSLRPPPKTAGGTKPSDGGAPPPTVPGSDGSNGPRGATPPSNRTVALRLVVVAQGGEALPNARVVLSPAHPGTRNSRGEYTFQVPGGQYESVASAEGYVDRTTAHEVRAEMGPNSEVSYIITLAPKVPTVAAKDPDEKLVREDIRGVLEAYRTGYEQMHIEAIKQVYPQVLENELEKQFKQFKSIKLQFVGEPTFTGLDIGGGTARVSVSTEVTFQPRSGKEQKLKRGNLFSLQRQGRSWTIVKLDIQSR